MRRILLRRRDGVKQHYNIRLRNNRVKLRIGEYNAFMNMRDFLTDQQLAEELVERFPEITRSYAEELVRRHRSYSQTRKRVDGSPVKKTRTRAVYTKRAYLSGYWDFMPREVREDKLSQYFRTEKSVKKNVNKSWNDLPSGFKKRIVNDLRCLHQDLRR